MLVQNSVDMNIDLNAQDNDNKTAFQVASSTYDDESKIPEMIVQNATEFKIDLKLNNEHGMTAFHWACSRGNVNEVEVIIKKSAEFNIGTSKFYFKKALDYYYLIFC